MRDFFTEHAGLYYATLLRVPVSLANGLEMSATFLKGCKDSLTGHVGLSYGTLFRVPVSLASIIFANCFSAIFLKGC